jgi:indolepyruvate ferredoxin oxidoreductase
MTIQIQSGNELLIQGGLEAGFNLYTGYPGSPLADFFNILYERKQEFKEKGIRVVLANSEAHAAAMASGAKMAGQNVLVAMKSMGLHVASDALSVGNFANPGNHQSGVVVVVGDDPWSISTSTPADSRYLFSHLHIPFLEPSTPQELKDWMKVALELSQESSVYVGIILTTFMAEGGGRVLNADEKKVDGKLITLNPEEFNLKEHVMVPPNSLFADEAMIKKRFPLFLEKFYQKNLSQLFGDEQSQIGIVSTGAVFETLKHFLEENSLLNKVHLLKLPTSYPLDESLLPVFIKNKKNIIVVEEKRGFLERELGQYFVSHQCDLEIFGKEFKDEVGFPAFGGINYEILKESFLKLSSFLPDLSLTSENPNCMSLDLSIPKRLPTFCPGCPHRETLSLMKEIRQDLKNQGINLLSHGDVGCYSLSFLEPFKEMHDLSAMGQGGALGAGADIFLKNPSVVLMGDSTFFHSGMTTISNSVQMGHQITYILLDNDNTAMTGHQVTPRTGVSVEGIIRPRQNMLDVVKSLQVEKAIEVNPSDRYFYKNILTEYIQAPGVKVIVSNKECALTFLGRQKKEERIRYQEGKTDLKKSFFQINTLACEDCRECVEMTGCPGLSQTFDAYGSKVQIDPQICVSDSYCTKLKVCPSFEMVDVFNYHPTLYKNKVELTQQSLPLPKLKYSLHDIAQGKDLRILVIGVGGSGVTTISRVIAEAALEMEGRKDIDFKFVDQKGLAQRNGSVSSHLSFYSHKKSHGQVIPKGTADLLISPDLLEGARAIEFLSPTGSMVIDKHFQVPLSIMLDRGFDHSVITESQLASELEKKLKDQLLINDFKDLAFKKFDKSVYASAMMLGFIFQKGLLPFSLKAFETAFKASVPKSELDLNLKAFSMGRELALNLSSETEKKNDEEIFLELEESVKFASYPWQRLERFTGLWKTQTNYLFSHFPTIKKSHLATYIHDLIIYDHGKSLTPFIESALELKKLYPLSLHALALRALVKTYWIKDEVMVAHLMTNPMKIKKDIRRYQSLGTSYKVNFINRPHFDLGWTQIEFDFSPKLWMLKTMRHLRILRLLLKNWHHKEKQITLTIRQGLLQEIPKLQADVQEQRLLKLDSVKGYRTIRYKLFDQFSQG